MRPASAPVRAKRVRSRGRSSTIAIVDLRNESPLGSKHTDRPGLGRESRAPRVLRRYVVHALDDRGTIARKRPRSRRCERVKLGSKHSVPETATAAERVIETSIPTTQAERFHRRTCDARNAASDGDAVRARARSAALVRVQTIRVRDHRASQIAANRHHDRNLHLPRRRRTTRVRGCARVFSGAHF